MARDLKMRDAEYGNRYLLPGKQNRWDKPSGEDDGPLVDVWAICRPDDGRVVYLALSRGKPSLAQWTTIKSEPVKAEWINDCIRMGRPPVLKRLGSGSPEWARADWEDRVEAGIMERKLTFHLLGQQSARFWAKLWYAAKAEDAEYEARRKAERKRIEEGNDRATRAALGIDEEAV